MYRNHKNKLKPYSILGIIFTVALGVPLHFAYEWSNYNSIVAFFSPVNESTWEHLKLLVFPMLIYSIFEYIKIGSRFDNYIIAKAIGIIVGMLSIIVLFYTYTGIIGTNYLICDILIFVISVIIAFWTNYRVLENKSFRGSIFQPIGVILIMLIIIAFMWFSFFPPKIALFKDPITMTYGIL